MQVLLFAITFLLACHHASALSCYHCNKRVNDSCHSEALIECNKNTTRTEMVVLRTLKPYLLLIPSAKIYQCYELVAVHQLTVKAVTFKGCAYGTTSVCDRVPLNVVQKECRICTWDGCNCSARIVANGIAILALLVFIVS